MCGLHEWVLGARISIIKHFSTIFKGTCTIRYPFLKDLASLEDKEFLHREGEELFGNLVLLLVHRIID